jgi:hypothetical protein
MAPLSLRAWADEVAALRLDRQHSGDRRSSRRGITARDLVIEDRRERGADAGR